MNTKPLGIALVLLTACGPVSSTNDSGTDGSAPNVDAGSMALVGSFKLSIIAPTANSVGTTTVVGRVQDGETPSQIQWTTTMQMGDCTLQTPRVPACSPACGSAAACVADGVCQRYPVAQNAGSVQLLGLRPVMGNVAPVELTAVQNTYQLVSAGALMFPAFADGESLTLTGAGAGAVPTFSVQTTGIAPLTVTGPMLTVAMNTPLSVAWTGSAMLSANLRLRVKLDISHHGGTRGMIVCDTDDDGMLEIQSPLISGLIALGVAGFPSIVLTRERTTTTPLGTGQIRFVVASEVEQFVALPGVRSCNETADCMGMGTCRVDRTCG